MYTFSALIHLIENTFWGRTKLINAYNGVRVFAGDRIFGEFYLSGRNWLAYTKDYSRSLTHEELQEIYSKLEGLKAHLEPKEIQLLVIIAPIKNTIYPEYVPNEIPIISEKSRMDQVISYQQEHEGVEILDLRPILFQARKERHVFYSSDTHWNPYGAYSVYQEIISRLTEEFPEMSPYEFYEFVYESDETRVGDIARVTNTNLVEEFFFLKLKNSNSNKIVNRSYKLDEKNVKIKTPVNIFIKTDKSLPDLLMYHDSFAFSLMQFLPNHFHQSTFIRVISAIDISFIESRKPDVVIIEFAERTLLKQLQKIPDRNHFCSG